MMNIANKVGYIAGQEEIVGRERKVGLKDNRTVVEDRLPRDIAVVEDKDNPVADRFVARTVVGSRMEGYGVELLVGLRIGCWRG